MDYYFSLMIDDLEILNIIQFSYTSNENKCISQEVLKEKEIIKNLLSKPEIYGTTYLSLKRFIQPLKEYLENVAPKRAKQIEISDKIFLTFFQRKTREDDLTTYSIEELNENDKFISYVRSLDIKKDDMVHLGDNDSSDLNFDKFIFNGEYLEELEFGPWSDYGNLPSNCKIIENDTPIYYWHNVIDFGCRVNFNHEPFLDEIYVNLSNEKLISEENVNYYSYESYFNKSNVIFFVQIKKYGKKIETKTDLRRVFSGGYCSYDFPCEKFFEPFTLEVIG